MIPLLSVCLGRTWGLCSPSGLWDFPWPVVTYPHRTVGHSVTGQLTGKEAEGLVRKQMLFNLRQCINKIAHNTSYS